VARPLSQDQVDFLHAIEQYKKNNDKLFLSWTEVLSVVKSLGYTRTVAKRNSSASTATAKPTVNSTAKTPTKKASSTTKARAKTTRTKTTATTKVTS